MIKIGDYLYFYDKMWREEKIVAETTKSWITQYDKKINKKTLLKNNGQYSDMRFYTKQQMEDTIWIQNNRYNLSVRVDCCRDVSLLKEIAKMLGVEENV